MTLFVHETHHVRGRSEEDFEAAYRDDWMPALAADADARLLWYCHHAHGSGPAYHVVTITAVRDGAAEVLDEAEDVVNAVAPEILDEFEPKARRRWWPFGKRTS